MDEPIERAFEAEGVAELPCQTIPTAHRGTAEKLVLKNGEKTRCRTNY